ncbi:hypothetical protein FG99_16280 [Pseudomonas sp. AAC]|nr:hypothetical protein FG99_16280 [Pseudomonas sp. AAC]
MVFSCLISSMPLLRRASEKSFAALSYWRLARRSAVLTTADSSSDSMCLALGFPRSAFNRHTALVVGG